MIVRRENICLFWTVFSFPPYHSDWPLCRGILAIYFKKHSQDQDRKSAPFAILWDIFPLKNWLLFNLSNSDGIFIHLLFNFSLDIKVRKFAVHLKFSVLFDRKPWISWLLFHFSTSFSGRFLLTFPVGEPKANLGNPKVKALTHFMVSGHEKWKYTSTRSDVDIRQAYWIYKSEITHVFEVTCAYCERFSAKKLPFYLRFWGLFST